MATDKLQTLFIYIGELALEANRRSLQDLAHLVFLKPIYALQKYPDLCDGRKRPMLQEIAFFFEKTGDQNEFEHIMERVNCISNDPGLLAVADTHQFLSGPYIKNSEAASKVFSSHW